MSDILDKIRVAQFSARMNAIRNGRNPQMASIHAGEQVVVEDVRRMEAEALAEIESRK